MIQKVLINQILKIVDKTIGKKFKIVDDLTDIFQGMQPEIDDLKKDNKDIKARLKQLEERYNENNNGKEESS